MDIKITNKHTPGSPQDPVTPTSVNTSNTLEGVNRASRYLTRLAVMGSLKMTTGNIICTAPMICRSDKSVVVIAVAVGQ